MSTVVETSQKAQLDGADAERKHALCAQHQGGPHLCLSVISGHQDYSRIRVKTTWNTHHFHHFHVAQKPPAT